MKKVTFLEPAGGVLTVAIVEDALSLVGCRLRATAGGIRTWTEHELLLAYDYAMREHLHASDNHTRRRVRPLCIVEVVPPPADVGPGGERIEVGR